MTDPHMEAARDVAKAICGFAWTDGHAKLIAKAITAGVAADRERCARVVLEQAQTDEGLRDVALASLTAAEPFVMEKNTTGYDLIPEGEHVKALVEIARLRRIAQAL